MLWGVAVPAGVIVIGALLVGVAFGWFGGNRRQSRALATSATTSQGSAAVSPTVEQEDARVDPLAVLAGEWKSDTGRIYDAVISGDALEFRMRSAAGMERNGYMDGEVRFVVQALDGSTDQFSVKDKLRPMLPTGLKYDQATARASCQELRTEVNGKPLRARYDGQRLTVEGAKIAPARSTFLYRGDKVYACVKLNQAPATVVQSVLVRP